MDSKSDETQPVKRKDDNHYAMMEEALRSTFRILKYVMALMLVAFALSGLYFVEEGSVALHTRFGRIVGTPGYEISEPGGPYFAFPAPLDEVKTAPTTMQELLVENAFWFLESQAAMRTLAPAIHGSLLTGDKNIVHARWSASFQIKRGNSDSQRDILLFFHNVGTMSRARELVGETLQRAIVRVVGQTGVDAFYRGDIDTDAIRRFAQEELDQLSTGLSIETVSLKDRTVPLATLREFQAAGQAESEKARRIEEAGQLRAQILNRAAGAGHEKLIAALDQYERARNDGNMESIRSAEVVIDDLLLSDEVGGAVSSMIRSAMTSRTQTVEFVRGASQRFQAMLDLYNENPSLYRSRQIQDAIQRIFNSKVESFHLPQQERKTLYLELGRNGE